VDEHEQDEEHEEDEQEQDEHDVVEEDNDESDLTELDIDEGVSRGVQYCRCGGGGSAGFKSGYGAQCNCSCTTMLSVNSTLFVCSANEPVQSRRWGAGVHSANEPVQSLRVGLRDWTGLSAEGHPP